MSLKNTIEEGIKIREDENEDEGEDEGESVDESDVKAMCNLAAYYESIEEDYNLMKKYYLMAINAGSQNVLMAFLTKCNENNLALYKLLLQIEECSRSDFLKAQLMKLEEDRLVKAYNNKVRLFKRCNNFTQCPVCLEENVLNICLDCGHEICIDCYDPMKKCHYRCW